MRAGEGGGEADHRVAIARFGTGDGVAGWVSVVELPDHLSNRLQLDRLQRPTPNRTPALSGRSWVHSAIATYEQAPASTAATLTASTVTNR